MMSLDLAGIAVSSGSACSSGKVGRSHVLSAMGVAPQLSECGLRVSLGWSSTAEEIDAFFAAFETVLSRHRRDGAAA
jgi:cysteine desulfurase